MEGLVLKSCSVKRNLRMDEAPRGGAGIEMMPFAFFRIVFTEAPRGGAGIEISRRSGSRSA